MRTKGPSTDTSFLSLREFVSRQLSPIKWKSGRWGGEVVAVEVAFVPDPERWVVEEKEEDEDRVEEEKEVKEMRSEGGLARVTCLKVWPHFLMEY